QLCSPVLLSSPHRAPPRSYPLSLHDALPISEVPAPRQPPGPRTASERRIALRRQLNALVAAHHHRTGLPHGKIHAELRRRCGGPDRKSTRLNSSHVSISYAVFCLKKKKKSTD